MRKDTWKDLMDQENQYADFVYNCDETSYYDQEKWAQIKKKNKRNKSKPNHKKWND